MRPELIANLASFVVITIITVVVSFMLDRAGLGTSNALVLGIVCLVTLLIIFYFSRQRVWNLITTKIVSIATTRYSERIGLAQVYNNFNEAASDVKQAFEEASEARILIQLGEGVI